MFKRKVLVKGLAVMAGLFILSVGAPVVQAQEAPVERTGQTTCYDGSGSSISCAGSGQDGAYLKGVAWLDPRFTDNGEGTVTDNLTGLQWAQDANIFGVKNWADAITACDRLVLGEKACGSGCTDWRLPNVRELTSLVHEGYSNPALPNTAGGGQCSAGDPFHNVQSNPDDLDWPNTGPYDLYWTSTTSTADPSNAWFVYMGTGSVFSDSKTYNLYVWPVRGGN